MDLPGWDKDASPYHPGEQELHARLNRKDHQERMGRRIHRPYMPDQHQDFFAHLPMVVAGSVDARGAPWASILFGKPGFIATPDDRTVTLNTRAIEGDPFAAGAQAGASVSFVGIELPTRRRNRINGLVRGRAGDALTVDVVQSFGNCPQYIHTREMDFIRDPGTTAPVEIERFTALEGTACAIVAGADTLFVASNNDRNDTAINGGVDVNHRGGKPGFVRIDGNTLTIPDYIGNFAFNTLGNFVVNPKAGLLFIDFDTGDLVQMTGTVELLWQPTDEIAAFRGAERAWRFHLDHGHRLIAASPLRWRYGETSPNTKLTGDWEQAAQTMEAEAARKEWRPFRVRAVKDESAVIRSFHLEPTDGKGVLRHKPGQYLTIRVTPEGAARPVIRTYTLSSAPSDDAYRISVKREGAASTYLHDALEPGDIVETRAPNGAFWLDTAQVRPAVLIAGGVGITPMIAMARQVVIDGLARRHLRPLTVFHAARTTAERAFAPDFGALQKAGEGGIRYVSMIGQPAAGEAAGRDFHAAGRLTPDILQAYLPLADYDFFLCGPPPFMQAVYDMLGALGVRDARIFAESFGPATLRRAVVPQHAPVPVEQPTEAIVHFAGSGVEQVWTPKDGTLLELAESHGLTPDYGCRSGACGSCAVRLTGGKVTYPARPDFPPEDGDVLICCAVPAPSDEAVTLAL